MGLEPDGGIAHNRLKRRLRLWQVVAVVATVIAGLAVYGKFGSLDSEPYIAAIAIDDIIFTDSGYPELIDTVGDDDEAVALLVFIDSPGGGTYASEAVYRALKALPESKPAVAVMGSVAASGGYMAALGSDYSLARPTTITGSIGVVMEAINMVDMLDALGIRATTFKSGPLKAQPNPFEPLTDEARAATQALVDEIHDLFVTMVVEGRPLSHAQVLPLADGRVFSGANAVALGLVDAIGGEAEALDWLADQHDIDKDLPIHYWEIETDDDFLSFVTAFVTGKSYLSERLKLDGLISLWHPSLMFQRDGG